MSTGTSKSALRALVVDDEEALARIVASYLERAGFTVTIAYDGEQALRSAKADPPDLVILDLMLPGIDGVEVCRQLRTFSDAYVLMLTARSEELDKVIGLSVGADDYLTKPFSPRELVARSQAMLRRPRAGAAYREPGPEAETAQRRFGTLTVDVLARETAVGGEPVELTRTEFDLLATLSGRPRMVFSRRQLVLEVWGNDYVGDEHIVDVHIGHLRRKLGDDPANPRFVRTFRGVGYRMGDGS